MSEILSRLRYQHADLQQGAYYQPTEDPGWDATADAADEIEALRARLAEVEAERDEALELVAAELIEGPQTESEALARRLAEVEQALRSLLKASVRHSGTWTDAGSGTRFCAVCDERDPCPFALARAVLDRGEPR